MLVLATIGLKESQIILVTPPVNDLKVFKHFEGVRKSSNCIYPRVVPTKHCLQKKNKRNTHVPTSQKKKKNLSL